MLQVSIVDIANFILLVSVLMVVLRKRNASEVHPMDVMPHHHSPEVEEVKLYRIVRRNEDGTISCVAVRYVADHEDLHKAYDEPGLGIEHPDGSIEWGVQ